MSLCTYALLFSVCSISMNIANKIVAVKFQNPHQVVSLQLFVAASLLVPYVSLKPGWRTWASTVPILFLVMLLTSYYALQRVSIGSFVITRNITPGITYLIEYLTSNMELSLYKMIMLFGLLMGVICYERDNVKYDGVGVIMLALNAFAGSVERVAQKWIMTQEWMECEAKTLSFINNAVSFILLFGYAMIFEPHKTRNMLNWKYKSSIDLCCLAISCFLGFLLSLTGLWLQKKTSATSFQVIGCLVKLIVILTGIVIFDESTTIIGTCGIMLSITCSLLFFNDNFHEKISRFFEKNANTQPLYIKESMSNVKSNVIGDEHVNLLLEGR